MRTKNDWVSTFYFHSVSLLEYQVFLDPRLSSLYYALSSHSDTFFVDAKDGLAHIFVGITFEKFFTEPDLKTLVVLGFQFITFLANTVHTFEMIFYVFNFAGCTRLCLQHGTKKDSI